MSTYRERLAIAQKAHKTFVYCRACVKEYEAFLCVVPHTSIHSNSEEVDLFCPKCRYLIGVISLSKHTPFIARSL